MNEINRNTMKNDLTDRSMNNQIKSKVNIDKIEKDNKTKKKKKTKF